MPGFSGRGVGVSAGGAGSLDLGSLHLPFCPTGSLPPHICLQPAGATQHHGDPPEQPPAPYGGRAEGGPNAWVLGGGEGKEPGHLGFPHLLYCPTGSLPPHI